MAWLTNLLTRAAKKYSRKGIKNAHELLHKEMFVSSITFSFYPDPDDGMIGVIWFVGVYLIKCGSLSDRLICSHDYISDLHAQDSGRKFKTFKEWNVKGYSRLVEDIIGYAQYVDTERNEKAEEDTGADKISFADGPGMLPLIPTEAKGVRGLEPAKHTQEVIRSYFSRHYRKRR